MDNVSKDERKKAVGKPGGSGPLQKKENGLEKKSESGPSMPDSEELWCSERWKLEMVLEKTVSTENHADVKEVIETLVKAQGKLARLNAMNLAHIQEGRLAKPRRVVKKPSVAREGSEEEKEPLNTPELVKPKQPRRMVKKPAMSRKWFKRDAQMCAPPRDKPGEETDHAPEEMSGVHEAKKN